MTRAEMRRRKKESGKTYTRVMTKEDIEKLKADMTKIVADELLAKVIGISVLIIHDHFSELIRILVDGKSREQRFVDLWWRTYEAFENERLTLDDIKDVLKDECDLVIRRD